MRPRDSIRAHGELIHGRIIDIVRRVDAHERREQRPGAECAGGERSDVFGDRGGRVNRCGVVDARGKGEGCVGLDGVSNGDYGDLGLCG